VLRRDRRQDAGRRGDGDTMTATDASPEAAGTTVRTIPDLVLEAARVAPQAEAVVDGDVRLTFDDLRDHAMRVARALLSDGLEAGDRVSIWAPNSWRWIVTVLGASLAGAVVVPINTRFRGPEARDVLERAEVRWLFVEDGFLDTSFSSMVRQSGGDGAGVAGLPRLRAIVSWGEVHAATTSWDDLLRGGEAVSEGEVLTRAASVQPGDVSDILFTSGTSGRPKGVLCTHEQNVRTYTSYTRSLGIVPGDRYLMVNPFFHSFGLKAGIYASLIRRVTMLPLPTFDLDEVLRLLDEEQVTILPGAPTIYQSLLQHPAREGRLPSLRLAMTGAAVVPAELIRRMRAELGIPHAVTAYGLTEVCGTATVCEVDDDPETVAERCGRPIPGVELRIVDPETGREQPPGEPGEVLIRGYNVMLGYLDDPEATAEAIEPDGWLHTGDIGEVDERGYLRITDRLKDLFIVGGFNAYPAEIERVIFEHPDVADVAVVGISDERLGEVGRAFVVPAVGRAPTEDEVIAFCRDRLANYKVPRSVVVVDSLPRNASGKVLKGELRRV
jgi:HIP---CoA ligase